MGYRELCSIKMVLFVAWGGAYIPASSRRSMSPMMQHDVEASPPPAAEKRDVRKNGLNLGQGGVCRLQPRSDCPKGWGPRLCGIDCRVRRRGRRRSSLEAYSGMGPIQRSGEAGTYHPGPLLQAAPFNESIKRTKKKERQ